MRPPNFVKIDLAALRAFGPRRLGPALVAALLEFRPGATTADLAAWLRIDERLARRWLAGAEGRWRPGRHSVVVAADARDRTPGTVLRTPGTAPADARDRALHCSENGTEREGEETAPSPVLRRTDGKTDGGTQNLVAAYLARTIRRVPHHEAAAHILADLRGGAYTAADLEAYLAGVPAIRDWPRDLAGSVGAWLNTRNVAEAKGREMAAWSAWRKRLALLGPGEALWEARVPSAIWRAREVDAEAGWAEIVLRVPGRCPDFRTLAGPGAGLGWIFEVEAAPLLAQAEAKEA